MIQSNGRTLILLALLVVAASFFYLRDPRPEQSAQTSVAAPVEPASPQIDEFGVPADYLERVAHRVRAGETFSNILGNHGFSAARIHEIVAVAGDSLDVRRIRPGDHVYIYQQDSLATHLVYQPNLVDYVVVDLADSVGVYTGRRPVETIRKTISGVIEGSLYNAMLKQGGDPVLVDRIANEVYAWTIDFQYLQKGDAFTVVYEEQLVDDQYFGIGEILAVRLDHASTPHFAYRFEQDGFAEYFDEEGKSLRKALLKSPLRYTAMTSGYSSRRFHPVQKRYKAHLGTDYAAPTGTPIWSVGDGVVLEAQFKGGNGNYVKVRHNSTYTTGYLHMSRIAKGIRPGVKVKQGQVIGYVGSTGLATGPHVCYRFWKNGAQVDSRKEEMPPSEPVQDAYRMAFAQRIAEFQSVLDPEVDGPVLAVTSAATDLN